MNDLDDPDVILVYGLAGVNGPISLDKLANHIHGVYEIRDTSNNVHYVGQSKCIKTRIEGHIARANLENNKEPLYVWMNRWCYSYHFNIVTCFIPNNNFDDYMLEHFERLDLETKRITHCFNNGNPLKNRVGLPKKIVATV